MMKQYQDLTLSELMFEYACLRREPVTPIMLHTEELKLMGHPEKKIREMYMVMCERESKQTKG